MSKLLFDKPAMTIDRTLAKTFGLNESIVIQQIHYWIEINKEKGNNYNEGRYWVYNTIQNWAEQNFDFWSYDTVKRIFKLLEGKDILITGNFNRESWDRTKWYTINYEKLYSLAGDAQCNGAFCPNGLGQNAPLDEGKLPQTIPETTTKTTTEITTIQIPFGSKLPGNDASAVKVSDSEKAITSGAQSKKIGKSNYTQEFEKFWTNYPRKVEKKAAFNAWKARIKNNKTEDIITACSNYAKYCASNATEEQYIKHPSTFLGPNEPFKDFTNSAHISSKTEKGDKSTFSHYEQRQYDFNELEKVLLNN